MSKKRSKQVTVDDIYGMDRLVEILRGTTTMEAVVREVVDGAMQRKRDNYKSQMIDRLTAWMGIKTSDKQELQVTMPQIQIVEQQGCKEKPRMGRKKRDTAT